MGSPRSALPWRRNVAAGAHVLPGLALAWTAVAIANLAHVGVPSVSPLVLAAALGAALTNLVGVPAWSAPGLSIAARPVLRLGVVLLGFRLAVNDVVEIGGRGLLVVAVVVATTFIGTRWLGRWLRVSPELSLLLASGFAICGASAIAAVKGVTDAQDEEVTFAVAAVTLCGSLAVISMPFVRTGLAGPGLGAWIGASVHDVAQVIAAAATVPGGGSGVQHAAVVVKLTRVSLLAPLVIALGLVRRRASGPAPSPTRPPIVPLFLVGFVAAVVVRTTEVVPAAWHRSIAATEATLLGIALFALGAGARISGLRRLGPRPVALVFASWVIVAVTAWCGVKVATVSGALR